jgi:hypothetical protein
VRLESLGLNEQAVAPNRLDMLWPTDQHHRVAGARQHPTEVAADCASAHHRNFHDIRSSYHSRMTRSHSY